MLFCPRCSNLLMVETDGVGSRWYCPTCPYTFDIRKRMSKKTYLERKKADEVQAQRTWENIDSQARCPRCGKLKAYYFEMQIRSADEPATLFYKCADSGCNYQWREG